MKHVGKAAYMLICLAICAFPFVGMLAGAEYGTTENRELAKLPQWNAKGQWNPYFLQELGAYFEDHFAFRPLLVAIDANIQSKAFQVSNVDAVTVGEDGWLYYTASMDDYFGKAPLSQRGTANAAHNLSLIQQYAEGKGASFLFAPVPNKNSLYGGHMPYYIQREGNAIRQWELLEPEVKKYGIPYVDLLSLFEGQDEVLYLKRDSHWNQKGAMLAYRAIMEKLGLEHETYETVKAIREKSAYGDLSRMLYPLGNEPKWDGFPFLKAEPEWDYSYQKEDDFQYQTDTKSTEEAWIETENPKGEKTLLMSRDSFGNTLLPFMANAFGKGYFSRGVPLRLTEYMEEYKPDVVILEKVERELEEFAKVPPLMEGMPISLEGIGKNWNGNGKKAGGKETVNLNDGTSLEMAESENDIGYWQISGVLDEPFCTESAQIYIQVTDGNEQKAYEAFTVTTETSDYGYCLYLRKESLQNDQIGLEVIVKSGDGMQSAKSAQVSCKELLQLP